MVWSQFPCGFTLASRVLMPTIRKSIKMGAPHNATNFLLAMVYSTVRSMEWPWKIVTLPSWVFGRSIPLRRCLIPTRPTHTLQITSRLSLFQPAISGKVGISQLQWATPRSTAGRWQVSSLQDTPSSLGIPRQNIQPLPQTSPGNVMFRT